jgi:hypothetical protein
MKKYNLEVEVSMKDIIYALSYIPQDEELIKFMCDLSAKVFVGRPGMVSKLIRRLEQIEDSLSELS